MTLSPTARRTIDRAALVVTAVAIVILLGTLTERAAGPVSGPVWLTRIICLGFVLARLLPWLKGQHAQKPNAAAGVAGLLAFIGMLYGLTSDGIDSLSHMVGRVVLLLGVPAAVAWMIDGKIGREMWRDYRAHFPTKPDSR
jgi:hypothetical protein